MELIVGGMESKSLWYGIRLVGIKIYGKCNRNPASIYAIRLLWNQNFCGVKLEQYVAEVKTYAVRNKNCRWNGVEIWAVCNQIASEMNRNHGSLE